MKIRKSFVTNSSSASYVVTPSSRGLKDVARDMLGVMVLEEDSGWNDERLRPWIERLEKDLGKDVGIRFPSCEYDTHIWMDEHGGERKIIIHTCFNHPFSTIDYFEKAGYPEDGPKELYNKRCNSQVFYDLAKGEHIIGGEEYIFNLPCNCNKNSSVGRFYRSAEREAYEKKISDNEVLIYGNIVCCGCGRLIKVRREIKFYDDEEGPWEVDYHFEGYWEEKKKKRKKFTTMEEDFLKVLLEE